MNAHVPPPAPAAAPASMWTIYDGPPDAPDCFVARLWHVHLGLDEPVPSAMALRCGDIAPLRGFLAGQGFKRVDRIPEDDPGVVEVWL